MRLHGSRLLARNSNTLELLRRGWTVHAVDADEGGIKMLQEVVPTDLKHRLVTHVSRFENFQFPRCNLVWAGYSWPFCAQTEWPDLWRRICAALLAGGRVAGDLFGKKHAFAVEADVMTIEESALRELISNSGLMIEAFDVEDGVRPSGGGITRWHAFGIAARKPDAVVGA